MPEITHIVRPDVNPFHSRKEYGVTWCNKQLLWTKPSRTIDMALSAMDDNIAKQFPTCVDCLAAVYSAIGEYLSSATSGTGGWGVSYGDVRAGQTVYAIVTDHPSYPKKVYEGKRPYAVFDNGVVADDICEKWNGLYAGKPQPWPFYVLETVVLPIADDASAGNGTTQSSLFDSATSGTGEATYNDA